MTDRNEFVCNMKFRIKFFKVLIIKLSIIIDDDDMWQIEPTDEVFYLTFSDLCQRFSFHSFDEIIYSDHYKFFLIRRRRERIKYVDSPLYEGPW